MTFPFTDLVSFLGFLAAGLSARYLARLLEQIPEFVALDFKAKVTIVIVLNGVISVAAMLLAQSLPATVISQLDPTFKTILTAISAAWVLYNNQSAYSKIKNERDAAA